MAKLATLAFLAFLSFGHKSHVEPLMQLAVPVVRKTAVAHA